MTQAFSFNELSARVRTADGILLGWQRAEDLYIAADESLSETTSTLLQTFSNGVKKKRRASSLNSYELQVQRRPYHGACCGAPSWWPLRCCLAIAVCDIFAVVCRLTPCCLAVCAVRPSPFLAFPGACRSRRRQKMQGVRRPEMHGVTLNPRKKDQPHLWSAADELIVIMARPEAAAAQPGAEGALVRVPSSVAKRVSSAIAMQAGRAGMLSAVSEEEEAEEIDML